MPDRVLRTPQCSEVHYICVAADFAVAMIRELRCLAANNSRLALSMTTAGALAQQRLLSLLQIIESLRLARNAQEVAELIAHAKALLVSLACELEQLSSVAGCDFERSAPQWDWFGISSIPIALRIH
jgi:hypothetical protein